MSPVVRGIALALLAGCVACAEAVQPAWPGDASGDGADGGAGAMAACGAVPHCFEGGSSSGDSPPDCQVTSVHCEDGTTRFAACDLRTLMCRCTVLGGPTCECRGVTGFTPAACENIRNCCWR